MEIAALSRSCGRRSIMYVKPRLSSPSRFSAGPWASLKKSSAVSASAWPTLCSGPPGVKPGVSPSTRKSEMSRRPVPVRAATTTRSARDPLVMNVFEPLIAHPSPAGSRDLFAGRGVEAEFADPATPVLLRDAQAKEADAAGFEPDVTVDRPLDAMTLARREDRALHEVPHRFAEPEVLVLEQGAKHGDRVRSDGELGE